MVIQALSLVMIFSKLNIKNKFLIKIISFLTRHNFSAQLIHARLLAQTKLNIVTIFFNWIHMFKNKILFFKIYGVGIITYFVCISFDIIRFSIFKLLKIRKISIFLEKVIPDIINKILRNN